MNCFGLLYFCLIQNTSNTINMVKVATSIKIEEEVLERIKQEAKEENRPISNFIETVLIKYLKEKQKETPTD